jgi:hypothetical protein
MSGLGGLNKSPGGVIMVTDGTSCGFPAPTRQYQTAAE